MRAHAAAVCTERLSDRTLSADRQLQTHWPKGRVGLPTRQVEDRQSSTKQTLKRSARNGARCGYAGRWGVQLPPSTQSHDPARCKVTTSENRGNRKKVLGDTETAAGRQCPDDLVTS